MSVKNKNYHCVKLSAKVNNRKCISSYCLNVSLKEAQALGFVNATLKKQIIDNKLIISVSDDGNGVKLSPKKSGKSYISSYNINISTTEASALKLINVCKNESGFTTGIYHFLATKNIVDNTLVVSRAYPQTGPELEKLLDDFFIGKTLSKKNLLDFLHFVEGDSESYFKQRDKIFDSIRYMKNGLVWYQGEYGFFSFKVAFKDSKVDYIYNVQRTICDYF